MKNLINGQKPEFGNHEHIKWVREQAAKLNGELNVGTADWQFVQASNTDVEDKAVASNGLQLTEGGEINHKI
jgi:hypothetical protein